MYMERSNSSGGGGGKLSSVAATGCARCAGINGAVVLTTLIPGVAGFLACFFIDAFSRLLIIPMSAPPTALVKAGTFRCGFFAAVEVVAAAVVSLCGSVTPRAACIAATSCFDEPRGAPAELAAPSAPDSEVP